MSLSQARHIAIVPAAGIGQRFGGALPKQYALLNGRSMLYCTVQALLDFPVFDTVCVVLSPEDAWGELALKSLAGSRLHCIYEGGVSRADTVRQALEWCATQGAPAHAWAWVHDAARPGVQAADLARLLAAQQAGARAMLLAVPAADTLKRSNAAGLVATTLERRSVWQAQTPQVAQLGQLQNALNAAMSAGQVVTDEASALELLQTQVTLVHGSARNFKVTTQDDAQLMESILKHNFANAGTVPGFRIGEGMDVHALVPDRALILGGVTVPHTHGLLGHSDADALCHALTDALLGAANLGDIGRMFPDSDAQYAGADSTVLLAKAYAAVQAAGWRLGNADATIIAQAPKLAAFLPTMQERLAQVLGCDASQINIKAKTNEALGFLGRKEGIECRVTVLLVVGHL